MDTRDFGLYYRSKYDDISKFKYRYRQYNSSSDIFEEIKYSDFKGKFKYTNKTCKKKSKLIYQRGLLTFLKNNFHNFDEIILAKK